MNRPSHTPHLSPWQLWCIAVGMVISGQYFGWNYAITQANHSGLLLAFTAVSLFYCGLIHLYLDLVEHTGHEGGIQAISRECYGQSFALLIGCCGFVEYFFGGCGIALATASYAHSLWPHVNSGPCAGALFILFALLYLKGFKQLTRLECAVTLCAVIGLILFFFLSHLGQSLEHIGQFTLHAPKGTTDALPYLIWLYLGIEGAVLCLPSKQACRPQGIRAIRWALVCTMMLSALTVMQVGLYGSVQTDQSINPLPSLLNDIHSHADKLIDTIKLFGLAALLASFNGMMMACINQGHTIIQSITPQDHTQISSQKPKQQTSDQWYLLGIILCAWVTMSTLNLSVLLLLAILGALVVYAGILLCWFRHQRWHSSTRPNRLTALATSGIGVLSIHSVIHFLF